MVMDQLDERNYNYRKDTRDDETFDGDIGFFTDDEDEWAKIFEKHLLRKNPNLKVRLESYGNSKSGQVVFDRSEVSTKADYCLIYTSPSGVEKKINIEIKAMRPGTVKFSIKENQITPYIRDHVYVLVPISDRGFCIIHPDGLSKIKNTIPVTSEKHIFSGKDKHSLLVSEFDKLDEDLLVKQNGVTIFSWVDNLSNLIEQRDVEYIDKKKTKNEVSV